MGGVVGDAVRHASDRRRGPGGHQAGEVDPAGHMAVGRVDAGDVVGEPDVGQDLALHPLQLVERLHRYVVGGDGEAALLPQSDGVEEAQLRGAVARDQLVAVAGQRPSLAGIGELASGLKVARS